MNHVSKRQPEILRFLCAPSCLFRSIDRFLNFKYSTDIAYERACANQEFSSSKSKKNHHDLASFLEYAGRNNLDPKSTVYVGTHYEYTVKSALERMGMSLKRTGGRGDLGTDIVGRWPVPSAPYPLKVLIQCKAYTGKINPAHARELEGAFTSAVPSKGTSGTLALLVTPNPVTKGVRDTLGRSRWPMGFVLCSEDGKILQMIWNKSAAEGEFLGIECGIQFSNRDITQREIVLTWKGKEFY